MKKILACMCIGALCLGMTACGSQSQSSDNASSEAAVDNGSTDAEENDFEGDSSAVSEAEVTEDDSSADSEITNWRLSDEEKEKLEGSVGTDDSTDTNPYANGEQITLNESWTYANESKIHTGAAVMYKATANRKNIIVGVNAGHGTSGGESQKTYCHPDHTAKTTGGSTAAGSTTAASVSSGMTFHDGTAEATVTEQEAQILKDKLLAAGYDVLMIRDGDDVQLDNIARTVICNNVADCHIAIHWDGDNLSYDKGAFYMGVDDGIKNMEPVASTWEKDENLGQSLISGLTSVGVKIYSDGRLACDLTQTSYSSVPSVDIELGNAASDHSTETLEKLADGLLAGVNTFFSQQ